MLGAVAVTAQRADAHARVVAVSPADGVLLETAPASVSVSFNETVDAPSGALRLIAPSGSEVAGLRVTLPDRESIAAELPGDLGQGTYTAVWRAVSADGHPVSGTFTFSVGERSAVAPAVAPTQVPPWAHDLLIAVKALDLLLICLLVGGAVTLVLALGRASAPTRRALILLLAGAALGLAAVALASLALQSAELAGSLGDGLSSGALGDMLSSPAGPPWVARIVLAAALCALLLAAWRSGRLRAAALACAAFLGLALTVLPPSSGHARTSGAVAIAVSSLHVAGAAVWAGGLAALAFVLWRERGRRRVLAADAVPRFSTIALIATGVLVVAGIVATIDRLDTWGELAGSTFGRLVLAKVALLLLLVAAGAFHRRHGVPLLREGRDGPSDRRWFGRVVGAELVVLVAVIGLTAVLAQTSPASGATARAHRPADLATSAGPYAVRAVITPALPGDNHIALYVRDGGDRLVSPDEVRVRASSPSHQVAPFALPVTAWERGHFSVARAALAVPGEWVLEVSLRTGDFDEYVGSIRVDLTEGAP